MIATHPSPLRGLEWATWRPGQFSERRFPKSQVSAHKHGANLGHRATATAHRGEWKSRSEERLLVREFLPAYLRSFLRIAPKAPTRPLPSRARLAGSGTGAVRLVAENDPLTLFRSRVLLTSQTPPGQKKAVICAGVILGMVALNPPTQVDPVGKPPTPVSLARPNIPIDRLVPKLPRGVSTTGDPAIEHVTVALTRQLLGEPAATPSSSKAKFG